MREQWKPIPEWEELYEISNRGRVRNAETRRIRALSRTRKKYQAITLTFARERSQGFLIHRLVALVFIGARPSTRHNVAHIDGDRANNRVENLRWSTYHENEQDKIQHATFHQRGVGARGSRLAAAFAKSLESDQK